MSRERLHALLDARLPGAVWLHGPTGAGKTVLLRSQVQRAHGPSLWLTVDERHRDPAALFAAIGAVAAPVCGAPLPVFSPEHRGDPSAFARDYFARLDRALPASASLVVDDVHHLAGTSAALLAHAIDAFGGRRTLCFASQLMPDASFAPQLAGSRLWVVGHRLLAFDDDEAEGLAARLGASTPALGALVGATDGWAAGLMLAMQLGAGSGDSGGSGDPLEAVRLPLAMLIAGQVLGGVAPDELVRLRLLAELPQVPAALADVAPDWAGACARLQGLADRGLFVERLTADRPPSGDARDATSNVERLHRGSWRLHDLLRSALRDPNGASARDPEIGAGLTSHLLSVGRVDLAWQLAAHLGHASLEAVARAHGGVALRNPQLPVMLQTASPLATEDAPGVAIWQARGLIGSNPGAALQACDAAYRGFAARNDGDGVALSAALALFVVFATIENVGAMSTWSDRFVDVSRATIDSPDEPETRAIRIAGEVVHDLLLGGRSRDASECSALQDRLMTIVVAEVLSADETIVAGSLLVAAMRRAIRGAEVELAVVRVESLSSYRRAAPHIRANWKVENGYHFTRLGLPVRARQCFEDAVVVADENALSQPRIGALIGLVRLELGIGDTKRAAVSLATLEAIGSEHLGRQNGWVQHLRARVEALTGSPAAALARIALAETLISSAGFPPSTKVILDQDRVQLLYATGAVDESLALAADLLAAATAGDARRLAIVRGLLEAHAARHDDRARAEELLRIHLPQARAVGLMWFGWLLPRVAAEVFSDGLRLGIETEFLLQAVRARRLPAPADAPRDWPWPVRIEVMRPFALLIDGVPLESSGKAQQKPLELLKYLACDRHLLADSTAVAAALWPTAEDAAARKSLEVTVARLRKLLGDDTLLLVREGKVSLDRQRVSSDAREFIEVTLEAEAVAGSATDGRIVETADRLQSLFGRLPLEHEESSAWREAVRERFRTAFVRAVRVLASAWAGDPSRMISLLEAAVVQEPLAENLYRLLMRTHLDAGNATEAMRIYRQCRQMLSVLIGAKPSAETERLKDLIRL